jgi:hypothetical protein
MIGLAGSREIDTYQAWLKTAEIAVAAIATGAT